ncbi:MAG: stage III sporulation protein AG [Firmicutes bacterium]|nr:stage III sporulation protein AG [Bacillota bacterium]
MQDWKELYEKGREFARKLLGKGAGGQSQNLKRKSTWMLVLLGLLGVILLIAGNPWPAARPPAAPKVVEEQGQQGPGVSAASRAPVSYEESLKQQLAATLTQMEGVGEVAIQITLASGPEFEYARKETQTTKITQEQDRAGGNRVINEKSENREVTIVREDQGRTDRPVIVVERRPQIRGVLVVADGARDPVIRARLTKAVQTVLGIPAHRVQVLPRKSSEARW